MVKSSNICDATVQYLDYRAYGLLFAFIMAIFRAFYVGIAQTKILTYSSIVMVLSNIILNYALIFGKFGLPEMGIAGAALASSIAEGIAMLYYIGYTLKAIDLKKYGFYSFSAFFKLSILKKVFTVSFWMMLQPFLSISVWFFFFLAVEHLGERSLAVVNLARTLSSVPFLVTHACATTASSLVSNLIGEGKINLTFRLVRKITISGICTVTPMLLFIAIFPELVLKIYTNNSELIADSINVIYVMCVASFIQIPAFILFNVVSGTGAVKMTVFIESVTLAIYTFFVYLIIIRMQSTPAISWTVEIIYQATSIFLCLLYLKFGNWRQKRI
jgi:Na+-driven multidrug efflux pump